MEDNAKKTNLKKILLDTNILLAVYQFHVDIFSEIDRICHFNYKIYILDKTVEELENIVQKQKGKHKEAAKIALQLLKIKDIEVIPTKKRGRTDDLIAEYASKEGFIVATQDKDLKTKLIHLNVTLIVLRKMKFLALANDKGL